MIRSIRTVMLLVGINRTSSSNQFHCISSTYHTLTVTYTLDWGYKLTDEPVFVSEMYLCPCDIYCITYTHQGNMPLSTLWLHEVSFTSTLCVGYKLL